MKTQINILSVLLTACGMYASAQLPTPIAPAPVLPEPAAVKPATPTYSLTTSKDWQNPAALRDTLARKIQAKLKGTDEASVKNFLKSEYNRLLLANWYLANAEIASDKAYDDYATNLGRQLNNKTKKLNELEAEVKTKLGRLRRESSREKMRAILDCIDHIKENADREVYYKIDESIIYDSGMFSDDVKTRSLIVSALREYSGALFYNKVSNTVEEICKNLVGEHKE